MEPNDGLDLTGHVYVDTTDVDLAPEPDGGSCNCDPVLPDGHEPGCTKRPDDGAIAEQLDAEAAQRAADGLGLSAPDQQIPEAVAERLEAMEAKLTRLCEFAAKLETALDNLAHHPLVGKFMTGNGEGE